MDKQRLQELGGVVAETTEQEKALEVAAADKPKVLEEGEAAVEAEAGLAEGGFGFGPGGHGADKSPEQNTMSQLAHMLRDAKVFMRDGNMEDAAMMIDRAYSAVSKSNRG